jgi:hypothetical protein
MSSAEASFFDTDEYTPPISERLAAIHRANARTVFENARKNAEEVPCIAARLLARESVTIDFISESYNNLPPAA